ncbi:MAG: 16S rRNA (cytosine(1402)-N(4))-methyltransferase RsmH [Desulfomonilia bacterium]|nr:16S rRNA (cytosine(1402)-N(4))-methyltransferase RsmH [Desulfomonilia bacterium]
MQHAPVLLNEVIEVIMPRDGGRYFDGTLGDGGHARAILEASAPGGELAGCDLDPAAINRLESAFLPYGDRAHLFQRNFTEIDTICLMLGWKCLDGILLDLGLSSTALDDAQRGFSFSKNGPLDMRFSPESPISAHQIVNTYDAARLAGIIRTYGEERFARRIAERIVESRPITSTVQLSDLVCAAIPRRSWPERIHPATRTFQAIRMEVNAELRNLEVFLPRAASLLAKGGTLAIISFHSLEDRIVKQFFSSTRVTGASLRGLPPVEVPGTPKIKRLFSKPLSPSTDELQRNPRSRSAHLRAARRVS